MAHLHDTPSTVLWFASATIMAASAGCTFDASAGGRCDTENLRKNGYVCRGGQWRPIAPDASSGSEASETSDVQENGSGSSSSPGRRRGAANDGTSSADVEEGDAQSSFDTSGTSPSVDGGSPECRDGSACASGVCKEGTCRPPTCDDDVRNGAETAVDCGGPDCDACPAGRICKANRDCAKNLICQSGQCQTKDKPTPCKDGASRKTSGSKGGSCGYKGRGTWYDVCRKGEWRAQAECRGVWYASCREYVDAKSNIMRGRYELDPDGPKGSASPRKYLCNEDGWTRVTIDNFKKGSADGWSPSETSQCGRYGWLLGGAGRLGSDTIRKTYKIPPIPHQVAALEAKFVVIDDWEFEPGRRQDEFVLRMNGSDIQSDVRVNNGRGSQECGSSGGFGNGDREKRGIISGAVRTGSDSIAVEIEGRTTDDTDNESWGLDEAELWIS